VAGERGCGVTARGCGAMRGRSRAGLRTADNRASGQRDKVCLLTGLGCIGRQDTCRMAYAIYPKIIKKRILWGYVSWAYRTRIRIRYVSDTRYAASVTYPCNIDFQHVLCNMVVMSDHLHVKEIVDRLSTQGLSSSTRPYFPQSL